MTSRLPPLDLLRGFEAAGRRLSFTLAAQELFVTQSAISRQVKALEEHFGVALFERHHRAIRLTPSGRALHHATTQALELLNDAARAIGEPRADRAVTVSCSIGFASLWLVPRLLDFRDAHPEVEIRIDANNRLIDLEHERVEVAVRYCPTAQAPQDAIRLLGEEVFPVCSPSLLRIAGKPLAAPDDLRHHVLLHYGTDDTGFPSASWTVWAEAMRLRSLQSAGTLRFSHYDQLIQAAVDGQGVALGISPLVRRHIQQGRLKAPFDSAIASPRAYHLLVSRKAAHRAEVQHFVAWLREAARREPDAR